MRTTRTTIHDGDWLTECVPPFPTDKDAPPRSPAEEEEDELWAYQAMVDDAERDRCNEFEWKAYL